MNERLNETTSIDILQFMLEIDPTLPRGVDDDDYLPIYYANMEKNDPPKPNTSSFFLNKI